MAHLGIVVINFTGTIFLLMAGVHLVGSFQGLIVSLFFTWEVWCFLIKGKKG